MRLYPTQLVVLYDTQIRCGNSGTYGMAQPSKPTSCSVRITEATRPPCPRFHVDRIPARAVLTLEGPGSQYLLDADVRREKLGHGSGGLPDESSGLIVPGAHIHSVEEGRLSLFKGEEWPRNAGRALVHRSPPATGRRRWLMTVDLL